MENTLSELKKKERLARQDLIIDAARTLFGRSTYDRVSMAEIARTAGIAKSSIYTYFPNQEALFVEIAWRDTEQFVGGLEKDIESCAGDPVEALITGFLEYYLQHEARWRMITHFALNGNKNNASVDRLNAISRRVMDCFEAAFARLAPASEDNRLMAHTLFSALSGILISFRKYPGRSEEEKRAHMLRLGAVFREMFLARVRGTHH